MRLSFIIIFLIIILTGVTKAAENSTVTLDQILENAVKQNPSIAAAYYDTQAALTRPAQAATPPDPEFMIEFKQVPIDTMDVNQGITKYMVQQQIPFPSKLVYGYKAEKHAAESKQSRENLAAQEIVREVKVAYYEAWRLQEEEKINHQTLSIYNQNKGISETDYATLQRPAADPIRASVDLGEIEAQLVILEQERLQAFANLSSIIAEPLDPTTKIAPLPDPIPVAGLNELLEKAKAQRPEITEAKHMVVSESAKLSLAKSQYAPDLTLRWGYINMPGNQQNAWTGRIGLSIPLWSVSKQRHGVRESKSMLNRARSIKQEAELNTEANVKSTYAKLVGAKN